MMTSIHSHISYINPHPPPRSTNVSPPTPNTSLSLSKSHRSEASVSDSPSSEPLLPSFSQNTHHPKSDADHAPIDPVSASASLDANPFASPFRPHVSPREFPSRSYTLHVIQSAHSGLAFPTSPRRTSKPLSRRRSTRSTASSSDSSPPLSSQNRSPQQNTTGIGRKVADSLQLFKESVSSPATEIINPLAFTRAYSPSRRRISSHPPADDDGHVIGPHFEFVKRSDWQEREAAALRRETLALDRARTRETEPRRKERADPPRDGGLDTKDLAKQQDPRGRPRGRRPWLDQPSVVRSPITRPTPHAQSHQDLCLTPVVTSPHPYPSLSHSPSPSKPISIPGSQFRSPPHLGTPTILSSASIANRARPSHSRSPTPVGAVPEPSTRHLHHDLASIPSPWTTDDESGWESASATSSSSASSPTSPPEPLDSNPGVTWPTDDEYNDLSRHTPVDEDVGIDEQYHTQFDSSEDVLPHIPLRPFRNQVGGHTSIYKFTKRAVCKVYTSPHVLHYTCLILYET